MMETNVRDKRGYMLEGDAVEGDGKGGGGGGRGQDAKIKADEAAVGCGVSG